MLQNKHVIRLSFIALFLTIIGSILLYRYFVIEQIILEQRISQNIKISEAYKTEIWDTHQAAVEKLKRNDYKTLLSDIDFIQFLKDSLNFFKTIDSYVSLYDMYGNKILTNKNVYISTTKYYEDDNLYNILSTDLDRYFLKNFISDTKSLTSAFQGEGYNILNLKALINYNLNNSGKTVLLTTYAPIIDNDLNDFLVDALLEINTDIFDEWYNISILEKRVFITFIVIFFIFFSIVIYNTSFAQKIINKQFENNRALEEAKLKAEIESTAKTEFLANVSHELRTPLNAIIGFSEMILTETYGKIDNPQYQSYINDINNSGKHLLSVINDILDFSKASADKLKVDTMELDLNKLASSSMRFVKPRADEAKVQLIESLPKEHIIIKADPKRLKQALLNLLSNSVKFTPEEGSVTLKIEKDDAKHLIYVKVIDTGIGMSEKDIPKALSTFGQIDSKLSRRYEGTGLGLPLTKKLVELMQGKFEIQSKVGVGTTITLTFNSFAEI